ncbi:hypothetical protein CKAH01_10262 [Colletotrichum kahawae]|uniref:Uncharacterized protein n=1 Tax=Colletotrichum kahawae TaxID=34407 RepID=A0AAD9XZA4_COLKA|nr:hypothetical protein CKAH01_10262 [Colletotrichum kahawae]
MSPQSLTSFDVVSDWVSTMSFHAHSPQCSMTTPEAEDTARDRQQESMVPVPGLPETLHTALLSKRLPSQTQHHITCTTGQSHKCMRQRALSSATKNDEQVVSRNPPEQTTAETQPSSFRHHPNICAVINAEETSEWEDSTETSESTVERLEFIRRVGLDGTAASCSLIAAMLKQ